MAQTEIPTNITIPAEMVKIIGAWRQAGHAAAAEKVEQAKTRRQDREQAAKERGAKGGARSGNHVIARMRIQHTRSGPVSMAFFISRKDEGGFRHFTAAIEDAEIFPGAREAERVKAMLPDDDWQVVRESQFRIQGRKGTEGWNTWARLSDSDLRRGAELGLI